MINTLYNPPYQYLAFLKIMKCVPLLRCTTRSTDSKIQDNPQFPVNPFHANSFTYCYLLLCQLKI